jgi:hypothetical protein
MPATGLTTPLSGTLRITAGLLLMAGAIAAGYLARSPWIILVLALAFTVSFVFGKWSAWTHAARGGSLGKAFLSLPVTALVQAILVGLLYLIGRGAGALFGPDRAVAALAEADWKAAGLLGLIGAVAGLIIARIESRPGPSATPIQDNEPSTDLQLRILEDPVTPTSFLRGLHYSHGTYSDVDGTFNNIPTEKSAGSDHKIREAEARLGVQLPESLKAIYRVQNGGSVANLCIPNPGVSGVCGYDDVIMPFSGYDDLNPTEALRTLYDSITDYADPDDEDYADDFISGCENMILLAQWYRVSLFLDYNTGGSPRVGFVDFDSINWQENARWWDDFDAFFAALRHYDDD